MSLSCCWVEPCRSNNVDEVLRLLQEERFSVQDRWQGRPLSLNGWSCGGTLVLAHARTPQASMGRRRHWASPLATKARGATLRSVF